MKKQKTSLIQIEKNEYFTPIPIEASKEFIQDPDRRDVMYHICLRKPGEDDGQNLILGHVGWCPTGGYYYCRLCTARLDFAALFETCNAGTQNTIS